MGKWSREGLVEHFTKRKKCVEYTKDSFTSATISTPHPDPDPDLDPNVDLVARAYYVIASCVYSIGAMSIP